MRKKSPFTQTFEQLPNSLPIFPLSGAVVLPNGALVLNIFEARYLNMVQDAMKNHQLIGMIQPKGSQESSNLYSVGCAARVIRYEETSDGRLEIVLQGLCRFYIDEELTGLRGYRQVKPNWREFQSDFDADGEVDPQSKLRFIQTLREYFSQRKIEVDWQSIEQVSQESLVNNLIQQLSLSAAEKQHLLEADSLNERVKLFTTILVGTRDSLETRH